MIFGQWGRQPRLVEQRDLEFVEREATLQALRAAIESAERCRRPLPQTT